jgi:hypothetical protein
MDTSESLSLIITSFTTLEVLVEQPLMILTWKLYVDGSSNVDENWARIVLVNLEEQVFKYRVHWVPNNEYQVFVFPYFTMPWIL